MSNNDGGGGVDTETARVEAAAAVPKAAAEETKS
jgi:hypothetical protein